eukprot:TRINITY_DN6232_c0_g1_i1.p1 TRINITY_DN6232_c0_g1~~TRINITY_DN6232_c0_g1_i1.p1  ORF type:complete len:103 (+),score=14.34 TRINITY_DN6232_c0_g1_i1:50-358(+)
MTSSMSIDSLGVSVMELQRSCWIASLDIMLGVNLPGKEYASGSGMTGGPTASGRGRTGAAELVEGIWMDRSGRTHGFLSAWLKPLPDVEGLNARDDTCQSSH